MVLFYKVIFNQPSNLLYVVVDSCNLLNIVADLNVAYLRRKKNIKMFIIQVVIFKVIVLNDHKRKNNGENIIKLAYNLKKVIKNYFPSKRKEIEKSSQRKK